MLRKKNLNSLNEEERRKERAAQEAKVKRREREAAKNKGVDAADKDAESKPDDGLLPTERSFVGDKDADKKDNVDKDILLKEAANIIEDEASLAGAKP
jgi:carboxyl-terminal processing protease